MYFNYKISNIYKKKEGLKYKLPVYEIFCKKAIKFYL